MSVGLLALLDDIGAIAKVAAATLDDVAGQAAKAGAKAAGVVIDDAAVTPRYVVGFAAARELPIVAQIALGSLRNKLLILLPAALALSYFLPAAITPLLMIGGVYLCYEGTEKVFEKLVPHRAHAHERALASVALDPKTLEDEKVAGAIKTDFILSAEIMAIALASIPDSNFWTQAFVLFVVAVSITAGVYGVVALIVKADDVGVALAKNTSGPPLGALGRVLGYGLVAGMPVLLKLLSIVGTAAMIWVGGGIIVHGMETYGLTAIGHAIDHAAEISAHALTPIAAMAEWLVTAIGYGIVGLAIGALAIPLMGFVVGPTWRSLKGWLRPRRVVMPTLAMAIVCLAAFLLYRTLSNYSLEDLKAALAGIPAKRIGLMILFAAASYLCLTGFDWLALRYVRRDVPYPRIALASFCSLSLGHNIGFAALSSGAIRYRFYTRWGASAGDVAKIIVFCGMTVGWGLAVLGGCASLLRPELAARITGLPQGAMILLGAALLALAALYLALPFLRQKPLQVWKWRIEVPSFRLAIGQLVIGPINFAFVAACLYQALLAVRDVPYFEVAAVYVIANVTSLISHVPGGLGVIETVVLYLLPGANVIGALIAFRAVYFLLPLVIGGPLFAITELMFKQSKTAMRRN